MLPIRTILFPTDFSEGSAHVFELADSLARDHGARLIVLHVLMPPPFVAPGEFEKAIQDPGGLRHEVEDRLRQYHPSDPGTAVEYVLADGDPIDEILHVAEDRHCELIVMKTHGHRGLSRLLLGSVAENILRRASGLVLSVRWPIPEAAQLGSLGG
jgi:universal stress protein A